MTRSSSVITRLWLDRSDLCVATQDRYYDRQGQQRGQTVTTTRYALPTLRAQATTTVPATPQRRGAECRRVQSPF